MAFAAHDNQGRRRLQIIIPNIVMDHLVVPEEFAGCCVERHQRIPEESFALPVGAVEIIGRAAEGEKHHAALHIDRHDPPDIRSRAVLPIVSLPGVVTDFAGTRHRVKLPDQPPRPNIEGPDCAARPFRGKLLQPRSSYDEVLINGGR